MTHIFDVELNNESGAAVCRGGTKSECRFYHLIMSVH
jgi:hypothetical protein